MAIIYDKYGHFYKCDLCGESGAAFNEEGNHVSCIEIEQLRTALAEKQEEIDALQDRVAKLEDDNHKLIYETIAKQDRIAELRTERDQLIEQLR